MRLVDWAARAIYPRLIRRGCGIYLAPPPFDHTKLIIIDDYWVAFSSTNWDPRSMRLNFELNAECYDAGLAGRVAPLFDRARDRAERLDMDWVKSRSVPSRLGNSAMWLFTPYL